MPLATLLNCSSLIPSRVIHRPFWSDNSRLSRRTTPQGATYYPSHNEPPFTAGCGLVRRTVSSPGTTRSVFWHRTTLEPHARSGSAAAATRCSPREPAFGTKATMACGGFKKSVRVRRRMGYTRSDFWTIRGRASSLFSRRATRPQRGPYEVLGALQVPVAGAISQGVQRNGDDSRGAAVIS